MNKEEVVQLNKLKRKTGLFFIIVMGVMLICFIFLIQFEVNKEKISASYTAEDTVRKIETQLGRYSENSEMFKNIISSEHTISDEQFNQLASYMKKNKNVIEAYELAPNGIIEKAYPLKGNEKVIGMNTLELPERQKEANIARKSGEYTIAGPYELKQGGTGALLFDPIYINDGNEKKFWGFSILVLNWDAFLEELEVDKLEDATYHFKVWKEGNNGKHVTIMSCGHSSLNHTLSVACEVPNDTWYFEIVPFQGWIPMSYKIFGSIVSVLVAILLSMGYWQIILRREKEAVYAKQIEKVATEAQHANQAKTRFLFNMSHDIRTPLNGIIGLLKINVAHSDDEKLVRENYKKMEKAANHLLSLINDVLQMSKLEDGREEFSSELVCLSDVFCDIQAIIEGNASDKEISWDFSGDVAFVHPYVIASPLHLRQIFLNIYGNSIKFTNPGGKISTKQECIEEKDNVITYRWTISDTGIGMSEEFLQHIFEPFSQEQADARSVYHGTGLGMSIVKKLVDKMGGMISVTNEIGKGSTFVIELPFEIASAPEKAKKEETDKKNNIHGLNLMLVEDNELNAEIAEMLLEDEGAIITMANDGQQAVELFNNNPVGTFDAILMDIMMPVMDGLAATKAIRSLNRPDAGTVPIIAMTANAFEEDVQKCLDVGMNAHLAKPLDIEKVKKTICEQIKIDCIKNNKCL